MRRSLRWTTNLIATAAVAGAILLGSGIVTVGLIAAAFGLGVLAHRLSAG